MDTLYSKLFKQIILCLCLTGAVNTFAQKHVIDALKGEWIKEDITLADGSKVFDPGVINSSLIYEFINGDTLLVTYNGENRYHRYVLSDSTLNFSGKEYKIDRLEKPLLELVETNPAVGFMALRIKMVFKPTFDYGISPKTYQAKNGEIVYERVPGIVDPKFVSRGVTAMDAIYREFGFPDYRKGGFVVRFVITKEGKMEGERIVASSHQRYDERLIKAVRKTSGKWLPAKFNGKPVNCEVEFNFDLGFTGNQPTATAEDNKRFKADQDFDYGNYYYDAKSYKSAIFYFTKAIDANPYLIEAYYKRAAAYYFLNDVKSACKDYEQLIFLDQNRAKDLKEKVCMEVSENP